MPWLETVFSSRERTRYTMDGAGLFVPAPLPDLRRALEAAELKAGELFWDLGSGDGRVVFLAAEMGAHARGIEADESLFRQATDIQKSVCPATSAATEFTRGDFLDCSFEEPDVIFYYGGGAPRRQHELYTKLERDMHPGTRLIVFRTSRRPPLNLRSHLNSHPPEYHILVG